MAWTVLRRWGDHGGHQLVGALGGSVTVERTVGVGATFTVRLPAWD
jgi:signal transduction histidine kinase